MKNKSKLNKIKQKNQSGSHVPKEWLYLNQRKLTAREVANVFAPGQGADDGMRAQLWEDAGIIEIELPEAKSMDMEWTQADLEDDDSNAYLEQNQIQSVFLVTIFPEDYAKAGQAMKKIVNELGGYFCGDTEEFLPVVK